MEIVPLGDSALVVRVDDSLGAVLATMRKLEAANIPGLSEVAPAFASVAVFLESPEKLQAAIEAIGVALRKKRREARSVTKPSLVEVPVCYDAEFALDLETVAQHCGLSPNDVVARHAAARYHVRCVGFTPGFPFLGGLPAKLATPRRKSPRPAVPAGSVGIGGPQTGIYPLCSPGGWNIIGRTPLRLFDVRREPAALFRAGDRVRFFPIERNEFERWGK
ncbi:MAG TPA: 5-oxoprolinase subunit PxpB [Chthoniobacteraceae bacterium]|nr:5-oxoprolinase subunit PxpB [Chthoniobacteraceae bacterium]